MNRNKEGNIKLIFIRHPQTTHNKAGIYQGRSIEGTLSREGKIQAQKIVELLKNFKIDTVYCSPLKRTLNTARIVLKNQPKSKLIVAEALMETNGGVYEGKSTEFYLKDRESWPGEFFGFKPKRGESLKETYARVSNFIKHNFEISLSKTFLIITHHNVLVLSVMYLLGLQPTRLNFEMIDAKTQQAIIYLTVSNKNGFKKTELTKTISYEIKNS